MPISSRPKKLINLLEYEFARIEEVFEKKQHTSGVPTGLHELDSFIDGIHPGDIIVVAGRPFMGKSDFLLNLAMRYAYKSSLAVGIFSMRHDQQMISRRIFTAASKIAIRKMVRGHFENDDWCNFFRAFGYLADLSLYVDTSLGYTDRQLLKNIEIIMSDQDLGLVVIDGLELMTSAKKHSTRKSEVSTLIRVIREFASKYHIPVIVSLATSQKSDTRLDNRPTISDLEEWESVAADAAKMVLFLYQPEVNLVYNPNKGVVQVFIAKNNYGETGTVKLAYLHHCCCFENLAQGYEEYMPQEND
jgi:replicative DNA helicase